MSGILLKTSGNLLIVLDEFTLMYSKEGNFTAPGLREPPGGKGT